jgi:hypothetical protein
MKTRYRNRTIVCMVLALLLVLDFSVFQPVPALAKTGSKIDTKSALIGGAVGAAAGAGIVLAAPAIGGALAGAGGIAGVGTAILGGAAAVVGGVLGVFGAVGGAIASAFAAVGGFVAGLIASPLFIPALILVGAAVVGYFAYKKYKESQGADGKGSKSPVFSADDNIYISPADYEMSSVIPGGDAPITVSKEIISIGGAVGSDVSVSVSSEIPVAAETPQERVEPTGIIATENSGNLKAAHDRYIACYQRYTTLVTNSGGADAATVNRALQEYRDAYNEYQTLRAINGNQ